MKADHDCFHSVLNYGIMFWGHCTETNQIFLLKKWIVRIINKEYFCTMANIVQQRLSLNIQFVIRDVSVQPFKNNSRYNVRRILRLSNKYSLYLVNSWNITSTDNIKWNSLHSCQRFSHRCINLRTFPFRLFTGSSFRD